MIPFTITTILFYCFYRIVSARSLRKYEAENKRIKEKGYISLLENPSAPIARHKNESQHLRHAYFAMKREQELMKHDRRLLAYDQREVNLQRQGNTLTLQGIEVAKGKIEIELQQQRIEIEGIFQSIEYAKRDLDLSTREQSLLISEQKFEFFEAAFQKTIQFEKAKVELTRKEFGLFQKDALQQLKDHGFLLRERELSLEARHHGLDLQEGMLTLRGQRMDDDATYRERSFNLQLGEYRNEMQRRENKLYLSLGELKNEQRSVSIERRSWQLRDEWQEIIEHGESEVKYLNERQENLRESIWNLLARQQRLKK